MEPFNIQLLNMAMFLWPFLGLGTMLDSCVSRTKLKCSLSIYCGTIWIKTLVLVTLNRTEAFRTEGLVLTQLQPELASVFSRSCLKWAHHLGKSFPRQQLFCCEDAEVFWVCRVPQTTVPTERMSLRTGACSAYTLTGRTRWVCRHLWLFARDCRWVTGLSGQTEYKMQSLAVLSPILHVSCPESTAV